MSQSYLDLVRDLQNQIVTLQTSLSNQDELAIAFGQRLAAIAERDPNFFFKQKL
ncbi:hypothetical protein HCU40_23930 [Pseudanabaena biceps]|nr:hypothetical protein [Pseudanabaena biceps]